MLDETPGQAPATDPTTETGAPTEAPAAKKATSSRSTAKKTTAARKTTAKKSTPAAKSAAAANAAAPAAEAPAGDAAAESATPTAEAAPVVKTTTRRRTTKKAAPPAADEPAADADGSTGTVPLFQAPDTAGAPAPTRDTAGDRPASEGETAGSAQGGADGEAGADGDGDDGDPDGAPRRKRRRGGRRRRKSSDGGESSSQEQDGQAVDGGEDTTASDIADGEQPASGEKSPAQKSGGQKSGAQRSGGQRSSGQKSSGQKSAPKDDADQDGDEEGGESSSSRRRRRRRRSGDDNGSGTPDDPQNTVTKVRQGRSAEDQITSLSGSTRLEAKKQRRREGREAGRRRAPIVSEAEFLARRESVDRVMAIRQRDDLTQIAVLEDKVLVEHYVARESQTSLIGNVYVGRVQNVLPSMEAAFIDIGKGRNAVLYAGEVNWTALGHQEGQPRKIESVLSSGQTVLVQVTKDPVGNKGARLTSQISLAGRFLVYVPDGTNSGISRKLPDTERNRLKTLLKEIVPEGAGVIVRTAAEGASEDELTRDVERLTARWADIEKKAKKASGAQLLYGEPDLMLKVVRDLFTEDFARLVVQGEEAWETVQGYVTHVAPDLEERLEKHDLEGSAVADLFATYRIEEQIHKGLDRKVWLPSGGSLIIDRTEAMTVVDVNTGKFTGSGGNLEETVTKNNLEAAEEMVRQLRLRDIGGIIVIDFIDMVLESNRDLVLRRLVECLGRDRTRHQVAEVTSLGLVQMTRKRIGTGLLEAFSETCTHCQGRGLIIADAPVDPPQQSEEPRRSRRSRGGRGRGSDESPTPETTAKPPSPKDVAAMARPPADDTAPEPDEAPGSDGDAAPAEVDATAEQAPATETAEAPDTLAAAEPEQPAETSQTGTAAAETVEHPAQQPEPDQADEADPVEEPAPEVAAEPVTEPAESVPAASPPAVVTRSRRRSARRPAGPPASSAPAATPPPGAVGSVGSPPESGVVEPGTADSEPPAVSHVPVKKRGSRKR